jgi:hypothetical protein
MYKRSPWVVALAGACLAAGCGEDPPTQPDFFVAASAAWSWTAPEPAALGYTIALLLEQRQLGGASTCREAPASTRLLVEGADVPLTRDPTTKCLEGRFLSAPVLTDRAVTARVEEEGRLVGEVVFDRLMPGTAASLVSPADGRVRAGDDLLIVPPPALPTSAPWRPVYYFLDPDNWLPSGALYAPEPERRLDGIHVGVPTFSGPAMLILEGMPSYIPPDVECPGFAHCTEIVEVTLGPFSLIGEL